MGFPFYVAGWTWVARIDPDTQEELWRTDIPSDQVRAHVVGYDGCYYVAHESSPWKLTKISMEGQVEWTMTMADNSVRGLFVDEDGSIFGAYDDDRLAKWDASGNLLLTSDIPVYAMRKAEDLGLIFLLRGQLSTRVVDPDTLQSLASTAMHTVDAGGRVYQDTSLFNNSNIRARDFTGSDFSQAWSRSNSGGASYTSALATRMLPVGPYIVRSVRFSLGRRSRSNGGSLEELSWGTSTYANLTHLDPESNKIYYAASGTNTIGAVDVETMQPLWQTSIDGVLFTPHVPNVSFEDGPNLNLDAPTASTKTPESITWTWQTID